MDYKTVVTHHQHHHQQQQQSTPGLQHYRSKAHHFTRIITPGLQYSRVPVASLSSLPTYLDYINIMFFTFHITMQSRGYCHYRDIPHI